MITMGPILESMMERPILDLILQRSRERTNSIRWHQRRSNLNKMPGTYVHKRLPPPAIANPEARNEPYTYFYRKFSPEKTTDVGHKIPLDGRIPPRRPGVDPAGTYASLPLYEKGEPYSFFFREGIPINVRQKMGMSGVQLGVGKPIGLRRGTAHLRPAKTVAPIHRGRRFASGGTDQKPILHGGSPATRWDGKIRNTGKKASWQTAAPSGGPVPRSSRKDPWCFLI